MLGVRIKLWPGYGRMGNVIFRIIDYIRPMDVKQRRAPIDL